LASDSPPHLDYGDLLEIEQLCSGIAAMAGDDAAVVVGHNGNDKSECGDAVGNLTDLLARMGARVSPVRPQLVDGNPAYINQERLLEMGGWRAPMHTIIRSSEDRVGNVPIMHTNHRIHRLR
jgi:hypothetical protein